MATNPSALPSLKAWIDATRGLPIPLGPPNETSRARADRVLNDLRSRVDPGAPSRLIEAAGNGPDVLYALCSQVTDQHEAVGPEAIEVVYRMVSEAKWDSDFDEGDDLLASLAFLLWDLCRKGGRYAEARTWRTRCVRHALSEDHIRAFVSSSFDDRSNDLNGRFLCDKATVLACWGSLDSQRNNDPRRVAREAANLATWLEAHGTKAGLAGELVHFLAAGALCTVMVAQNLLGGCDTWDEWTESAGRVRRHIAVSEGTDELLALMSHAEATWLCNHYKYSQAEIVARSVIPKFESMGLWDQAARSRFLLGRIAKDLGKRAEALDLFSEVYIAAVKNGDYLLQTLALSERAQGLGRQGKFDEAMVLLREASSISRQSSCPWAEADIQGTAAELLRDHGDFVGAIAAYTFALDCYEEVGMVSLAAYLRIILAETLLLAGRPVDAASHVVQALPVVEAKKLSREAVAAVGILREAVCRSQADPGALRQLRDEFQRMKDEGRL